MSLGEFETVERVAALQGRSTESTIDGDQAGGSSLYLSRFKPALDRVLALVLLVLTFPFLAVAAILVAVKLGRPLIYRQTRIGQGGEPFELYKLRTMIPDRRHQPTGSWDGHERRRVHKSPNDPRVPAIVGKLRSWRLDELPQFWNVLSGDMSLVGPRPEMPEIVSGYDEWQHRRHIVKPGITGPWQISRQNGKLMHECTALDLDYVDHVTFRRDLSLLVRTPLAMLGKRSGY